MRILSAYVLREFGKSYLVAASAFVTLFVIGDFIEKVDDYIEHHAAVLDVARYTLYQLPNVFFLMTPVAVLLATLITLGTLSRNSEIIAMKAGGMPLYRIAAPIFGAAAALSAVIFWANEAVIPYCNARAQRIRSVDIEKKPVPPTLKHDRLWFRGPAGEIINIGLVEFKGELPTCRGVTFYRIDEGFALTERVDAERMDWDGEGWVLTKLVRYIFSEGGRIRVVKEARAAVELPEKPDDFRRIERISDEMTMGELKKYIARLRSEGYNPVKYVVDLYGKTSFTLANIIMALVAVPFSLKSSRSGGMAVSVGVCVLIAISYWVIYSFAISLGHAGRFPPLFAAWVANLIFGFTGLYMYLQADR